MTENNKSDWRYTPNSMWSSAEAKSYIGEVEIKEIPTQKIAELRHFHRLPGYRKYILAAIFIGLCFDKMSGSWGFGFAVFIILCTAILSNYLSINKFTNILLSGGHLAEEEAMEEAKSIHNSCAHAGSSGYDIFFNPMYSSCSGNIYHRD